MWRVQNYNVFKEISKVSTSWQVEKTAGLIMSQKWLSLVFILITRVLKMFFRCEAKSYKAEAKSIIRQSQQDFFRWEADIIIKQADITFRVLKKKQKKIPSDFRRKSLFANREN